MALIPFVESKITHPKHVWCGGSKLAIYLVFWAWLALIRRRRLLYLSSNNTMNRLAFHQPGHSAARTRELLTLHLMPDLSDAVDFIVLFPNTFDHRAQIRVPFGTIGRQVWVFEDRSMRIECGLGDWQNGCEIGSTPKSSLWSSMKAIIA